MTRILVATDGSEDADRAIDYAARVAEKDGVDLLIVNVSGGYGLPDALTSRFTNEHRRATSATCSCL
jgi:nucleotide-binding universal stress UspA family protein